MVSFFTSSLRSLSRTLLVFCLALLASFGLPVFGCSGSPMGR